MSSTSVTASLGNIVAPAKPAHHGPAVARRTAASVRYWPARAMLAGAWLVALAVGGALAIDVVAPVWAIGMLTIASYVAFTPMHEAVHGHAARTRLGNWIMGNLAAPLVGPTTSFAAYRYLHLEHHAHTNERDHDPDFCSGYGPAVLRPLYWATTDLFYYAFYLRRAASRPMAERMEIYVGSAVLLGAAAAAVWLGQSPELLLYWIVPTRIASATLACVFNYLPHRPYALSAREDATKATRIVSHRIVAAVLSMGHSLHQVHHLDPSLPFYRYRSAAVRPNPVREQHHG